MKKILQKTLQQQVTRFQMQPSTPPTSVDWAKEMAYFRAAFLKVEPRFDPKLADRNILNSLFAWVWKLDEYNKLKLDYNKGFCFYGDIGLGKSMTLQALRQYRNGLVSRNESKREDGKPDITFSTHIGGGNQDVILAMANSGDYTLSEAMALYASCCERCMNVLCYKYLDGKDGYPEYSEEWKRCNTVCDFCKDEPLPNSEAE